MSLFQECDKIVTGGRGILSSVLKSERAIEVNIAIMRAVVRLRELLLTHKELTGKLKELEEKVERPDEKIVLVFNAIRQLIYPVRYLRMIH